MQVFFACPNDRLIPDLDLEIKMFDLEIITNHLDPVSHFEALSHCDPEHGHVRDRVTGVIRVFEGSQSRYLCISCDF